MLALKIVSYTWDTVLFASTYRELVTSKDRVEFRVWQIQIRELLRVQDFGLPNKTDAAERQRNFIRRWKLLFRLQVLVQLLANSRISAIGADKNITSMSLVVLALDRDAVVVLNKREKFLVHVDLFFRDLSQ